MSSTAALQPGLVGIRSGGGEGWPTPGLPRHSMGVKVKEGLSPPQLITHPSSRLLLWWMV